MKIRLAGEDQQGLFDGTSLEGGPTIVAYSRSEASGWTFGVAVPRDALGATARHSLYLAIAIGVLLGALGALAARHVARGITGPLETLASQATALGRGEVFAAAPTGLAETDIVSSALSHAGESIRDFTGTLEQKVDERTRALADANRRLSNEIDERQRAEEQLAHIQRLDAVGQLAGGIAHDFNNMLQAVVGNVDLARQRSSDPKTQGYLEQALAAAARGARLTGQLLTFSRRQRLETGPLNVNDLVTNVVGILQSTIGDTITIRTELAASVWTALGDATQLELAIVNLAINARDAMPAGGEITIKTDNCIRGIPTRPEEPPAGAYVELTVTDPGTGIPAKLLAKVFEPFFTTKEVGKGSGLGLSQVLGLTQQLGGGVVIDSSVGGGTSVRMYLPRAPE
jgi:signal transduction histidine kinase